MTDELAALSAPVRRAPVQKPGRSKQDYSTPREFLDAVEERFGPLVFDLAASKDNAITDCYFDEARNSLIQDWALSLAGGIGWLNPPFENIEHWARKCHEEGAKGARVLLLTPASVGSEWYARHVHRNAIVLALRPRLSFDGSDPYPKDLMLSCFGFGVAGFDLWKWK